MARLLDGTPEGLTDDTGILDRPKREKPIQMAEITPKVRERYNMPAADVTPKKTAPDVIEENMRRQAEADAALEKAKAEKGAASKAALGKRYQQIRAEFEPKLSAPAPQFEAPKESFAQLGALGAMMMVMGTMGGGKGLTSATGAMNAMAGMLQGYQQGRKDVFDRAKAEFEQNYKVWQENKKNIKEAFDRAIKFAPYDIQAATNKAVAELNSKGATTLAASVKTQGLQVTANQYASASDKADKEIETINDSIRRMAGERPAQVGEVGVALAGEPPKGTRLTKGAEEQTDIPVTQRRQGESLDQYIKRLEKESSSSKLELDIAKARKQFAPPAAEAKEYPIEVDGERMPATRAEIDALRKAGANVKYVKSLERPEGEEDGKLKPTASTQITLRSAQVGMDGLTKILEMNRNEKLKKEWDAAGLTKLFAEPLSDTWYSRAMSQVFRSNMSPEAQSLAELIMRARNAYYLETSGKAVTGSEAMRNFGAVIQPSDNWDSLMRKARNALEENIETGEDYIKGYAFPKSTVDRFEQRRERAMKALEGGRTEESAGDVKSQAEKAFGSYDPSKFDYRINPETGKIQRKPKGQ